MRPPTHAAQSSPHTPRRDAAPRRERGRHQPVMSSPNPQGRSGRSSPGLVRTTLRCRLPPCSWQIPAQGGPMLVAGDIAGIDADEEIRSISCTPACAPCSARCAASVFADPSAMRVEASPGHRPRFVPTDALCGLLDRARPPRHARRLWATRGHAERDRRRVAPLLQLDMVQPPHGPSRTELAQAASAVRRQVLRGTRSIHCGISLVVTCGMPGDRDSGQLHVSAARPASSRSPRFTSREEAG
jgi:hypothetical protein